MKWARFFKWLQEQKFYANIHREASAPLSREGGAWYDIGCGPGILTRIADELSFQSTGFDSSPDMILMANKTHHHLRFVQMSLSELIQSNYPKAQVVSASSFIFVLPESSNGLNELWSLVAPEGCLLLIETTSKMSLINAIKWIIKNRQIELGLLIWGYVRGGYSIEQDIEVWLTKNPHNGVQRQEHLNGLVKSWIVKK